MLISGFPSWAAYLLRTRIIYAKSATRRYCLLFDLIRANRIKTIMEIGVYDGRRALEMISTARIHHRAKEITYLGFDLFEQMDDEILRNQFSKRPDTLDSLKEKIGNTGARVELFRGFSGKTLPRMITERDLYPEPELVFIDGGHAVETIGSDWENVRRLMTRRTIVVFDDYYVDRPDLIEKFGCNKIVDSLGTEFDVEFPDRIDAFERENGLFKIRMAKVTKI